MKNIRKSNKGLKTKSFLLKTALELFSSKGYEASTMRDISKQAGLSLGAFYRYFSSKDELILSFYQTTADEAAKENPKLIENSNKFKIRFRSVLEYKLEQLKPHRDLIKILARNGTDFSHPLSPFSKESKSFRDDAIALIEQSIKGSDLKYNKTFKPYLSKILWLYQMSIILFWANDKSKDQQLTKKLLGLSLTMIVSLFKLSNIPLVSSINNKFLQIMMILLSVINDDEEEKQLKTIST